MAKEKTTAEKAPAKAPAKAASKAEKAAPTPPPAPPAAEKTKEPKEKGPKSITKSQFIQAVGDEADMDKKQVTAVMDAINAVIVKELSAKGPGVVALPGLFKLKAKRVKAIKGGKEVPNRFKKGEMTVTKDKPAHTKVSVRPLKGFKELLK